MLGSGKFHRKCLDYKLFSISIHSIQMTKDTVELKAKVILCNTEDKLVKVLCNLYVFFMALTQDLIFDRSKKNV